MNTNFPRCSLLPEKLTNLNDDNDEITNENIINDDGMTEVLVEWKKHLTSQKEELENYFEKFFF